MVQIRPFAPGDLDALYHICLATGDAGKDASALHSDGQLVGHIYAAPYGVLEPEHVLVAEDEEGVAGYVVGTHDTRAFEQRLEREWYPPLRERYRTATGLTEADQARVRLIMSPDTAPEALVVQYPAHIHMNLLPRLRGQKVGTRLLQRWADAARDAGVPGIHLGASAQNPGGIAFWSAVGFTIVHRNDRSVLFTMTL